MDNEVKNKINYKLKQIEKYMPLRRRLGTSIYCHNRLCSFPKYNGSPLSLDRNQDYFSLFDSMIVSYASCFSNNTGGNIVLNAKKVFSGKPNLQEFHDEIMVFRNKIIAHNEKNVDQCYFAENSGEIIIRFSTEISMPNGIGLDFFGILLEYTWKFMHKKIINISNQLEKEIGIKVTIEK